MEAQQNKQQKQHRKQPDNADKWHRQSLAHQLTSPLVSSLDVGRHGITWGTTDWAAEALEVDNSFTLFLIVRSDERFFD